MNVYTNGVNFSFQDSGNEVVLEFLQRSPVFDNNGGIKNIEVEKVASVIMPKQLAFALRDMLSNISNDKDASASLAKFE